MVTVWRVRAIICGDEFLWCVRSTSLRKLLLCEGDERLFVVVGFCGALGFERIVIVVS